MEELIPLEIYQAYAGAYGCQNPAESRAEWEQLAADRMIDMIGKVG
jgi:hypothetical protein